MNITEHIEHAIYFIPRNYINANFSEFFSHGGISVSTPFQYAFTQKKYLFSWDEIPGNDSRRLIEFLTQKFGIDWVKIAKIEKIDDSKTIRITNGKNFLSLKLDNEKNKINLEIDNSITDEFILKKENGKLNIYQEKNDFEFRTTIQLDADIIYFIPDPDLFKNDDEWSRLYEEKYQAHQKKVQHIFSKLEDVTHTFTWATSAAFSVIILYMLYIDANVNVIENTFYSFGYMIILTYIFKKFIIRGAIKRIFLKWFDQSCTTINGKLFNDY